MKNLIIGCITHYSKAHIHNWVESIEKSGFDGDKFMVVYVVDNDLISYLKAKNFRIFQSKLDGLHIVVKRFIDIHTILERELDNYKYVISTDVKDVVFQKNPSIWLENVLNDEKKVIVSSECLLYKNEAWGKGNMYHSFPLYADEMMEKEIFNAGTIAGECKTFSQFCKKVYDLSINGRPMQPDQAALNIITHILDPNIVRKTLQNEAWCVQLGTTLDPRVLNESSQFLLEPQPVWDDDSQKLLTSDGIEFALIHQYDRIPDLRQKIDELYK